MKIAFDGTNRVHVLWHAAKDADSVLATLRDDLQVLAAKFRCQVVAAFDAPGTTFRHDLTPSYKADRPDREAGLQLALDDAPAVAQMAGSEVRVIAGFEADDVLATIAASEASSGGKCIIASPDKDLRQCLVAGRVSILRHFKRTFGNLDCEWMTADHFVAKHGFPVDRWIGYQCLVGDSSDTIDGWDGVGPVTASAWLRDATLEEIAAPTFSGKTNSKQRASRAAWIERLPLLRQLVTLRTDVPLSCQTTSPPSPWPSPPVR